MTTTRSCLLLFALFAASGLQAQDPKSLDDASTPIRRPGPEFGTELKAEALKIGPTMDVAIAGEHVFAIGKGELRVLSTTSSRRETYNASAKE